MGKEEDGEASGGTCGDDGSEGEGTRGSWVRGMTEVVPVEWVDKGGGKNLMGR